MNATLPLRRAVGAFLSQCRKDRVFRLRSHNTRVLKWEDAPENTYFITSDKGLYRVEPSGLYRIVKYPLYGCTIVGDKVFMGLYVDDDSILVEGRKDALFHAGTHFDFREIFCIRTNDTKERLHQITHWKNTVLAACTAKGAILKYRCGDDHYLSITPIRDRFGHPIKADINHINSVTQYGDVVLFTAYRAGKGAMIGVLDGETVIGYHHANAGVHDVYLTKSGFLVFDTFGDNSVSTGGKILTENGELWPEFFRQPPGYIVRGAAERSGELLIGSSHKGVRAQRFAGNGHLIRAKNSRIYPATQMPFAQIYQILTDEGGGPVMPDPVPSPPQIRDLFERSFGPPVYEGVAEIEEHPITPTNASS
ncbi:MAG: hypothetical protein J4G10_05525 [Alphaproteobacteria bacterium]|nr:hypothetical protein [Alphaproteobacteria bacterium]